jgi:hypothetical protein
MLLEFAVFIFSIGSGCSHRRGVPHFQGSALTTRFIQHNHPTRRIKQILGKKCDVSDDGVR